jgi:hypothetical protein
MPGQPFLILRRFLTGAGKTSAGSGANPLESFYNPFGQLKQTNRFALTHFQVFGSTPFGFNP